MWQTKAPDVVRMGWFIGNPPALPCPGAFSPEGSPFCEPRATHQPHRLVKSAGCPELGASSSQPMMQVESFLRGGLGGEIGGGNADVDGAVVHLSSPWKPRAALGVAPGDHDQHPAPERRICSCPCRVTLATAAGGSPRQTVKWQGWALQAEGAKRAASSTASSFSLLHRPGLVIAGRRIVVRGQFPESPSFFSPLSDFQGCGSPPAPLGRSFVGVAQNAAAESPA